MDQELGEEPLKLDISFHPSLTKETSVESPKLVPIEEEFKPTIKDFPVTLTRVLSNKILMCNSISAICAVLGIIPYITFLAKYLEVQFGTSAAGGTAITGKFSFVMNKTFGGRVFNVIYKLNNFSEFRNRYDIFGGNGHGIFNIGLRNQQIQACCSKTIILERYRRSVLRRYRNILWLHRMRWNTNSGYRY